MTIDSLKIDSLKIENELREGWEGPRGTKRATGGVAGVKAPGADSPAQPDADARWHGVWKIGGTAKKR